MERILLIILAVASTFTCSVSCYKINDIDALPDVPDNSSLPEGALPGVFSVSGNKKVRFSKGNLWANATDPNNPVFYFESNQYDVLPPTSDFETEIHVGHFYWSKDATVAISLSNYSDSASKTDVFFTNDSNDRTKPNLGFTVNGQKGL